MTIKPPSNINPNDNTSVFLAGTIDMGNSEDWQTKVSEKLESMFGADNINIFNPRRDFWKIDWKQEAEDPNFSEQVNWELDALDKADIILLNFLPDSKSPISLFEFGLYAKSGKLIVCCPKEFYRSGNVHIYCKRFSVPMFNDINDVVYKHIKLLLKK